MSTFKKDVEDLLLQFKYSHVPKSEFKTKFFETISGNIQSKLEEKIKINDAFERNPHFDNQYYQEFIGLSTSNEFMKFMRFRNTLPVYNKKEEILSTVKNNQVVVISGETGCGKTTQISQIILDDNLLAKNGSVTRIICTQPRRIAAVSIAERVAKERNEVLGNSVGYQIRFEKKLPRESGSIIFCTTGILLQFMQSDPALNQYSHIILDEVHERSTESDFIIAILKQIIKKRSDLKVILMSATIDSERFANYYNNCPMIHIPGFTHPVKEFFLEDVLQYTGFHFYMPSSIDFNNQVEQNRALRNKKNDFFDVIPPYIRELNAMGTYPVTVIDQLGKPESEMLHFDLIINLIRYIVNKMSDKGGILIFLPGVADIMNLIKSLESDSEFSTENYAIYPLHSRVPMDEQSAIFDKQPRGVRKIVIATSIAESSITVEDVTYVIDSGRTKTNILDLKKNIQILQPIWISKANAKQRCGRAGRVRPGYCYRLYSRGRERTFEEHVQAEIMRCRLEDVILRSKLLQLGDAETFFNSLIDSPNYESVKLSLNSLKMLRAIDDDEVLTPLGYHLAHLPVEPKIGKMIIFAALFSCVDPIFSIAATLTEKNAFLTPRKSDEDRARMKRLELSDNTFSDHIAFAKAVELYEKCLEENENIKQKCSEYFLSVSVLKLLCDVKYQFADYLHELKFLKTSDPHDPAYNKNSKDLNLIKAIVCAALFPNMANISPPRSRSAKMIDAITAEDGAVKIHPSSLNGKGVNRYNLPSTYFTYYIKQLSSAIYLHDTTFIPTTCIMFAKAIGLMEIEDNSILQNATSYLEANNEDLIKMLKEYFDFKIINPGAVCKNENYENALMQSVIAFLKPSDY